MIGSRIRIKQLSHRIVVAVLCLSAFIFASAYSSTVTSYLMASKLQPYSKSLEDIASSHPQKLKLLSDKGAHLATNYFLVGHNLLSITFCRTMKKFYYILRLPLLALSKCQAIHYVKTLKLYFPAALRLVNLWIPVILRILRYVNLQKKIFFKKFT